MKAYTAFICQQYMRFPSRCTQNGSFRMRKRKFIKAMLDAPYLPALIEKLKEKRTDKNLKQSVVELLSKQVRYFLQPNTVSFVESSNLFAVNIKNSYDLA